MYIIKNRPLLVVCSFVFLALVMLQAHSDGRATRNRDNTGAPGGQAGGNGMSISCVNCHSNAAFEVGLDLELLDADENSVSAYLPNQTYTARVTINTLSGDTPLGYGFQMVSLVDTDDSDVNGWIDAGHSDNVQLVLAPSTGRVYAEHDGMSATNEFIAEWTAPAQNSGDISFYVAGIGTDGNGASSGDHAASTIRVTFPESTTTSTTLVKSEIDVNIYPNPVAERLTISGDIVNRTIEIYQNYNLVETVSSTQNKLQLSFSELNAGVYFVVIRDKENRILDARKVLKN